MARSSASAAVPAAALGVAAFVAAERAFVVPAAPRATTLANTGSGAVPQTSGPSTSTTAATGLAVAALSLVAARSTKTVRQQQRVTAARAEGSFAGGLIGGESAFNSFEYNFDPLGIAEKCPQYLPWFRESELKHGRICMLAWVGLVVPEVVRIPGPAPCYTASVVDAHVACVGDGSKGQIYWEGPLAQVFMFVGLIEMLTTFPKANQGLTLENAGDYQLGVSFLPSEPEKAKEMKLKELKNGRLAMLAFGGAITQAVLSGNGFPWLYANSAANRPSMLASSVQSATINAAGRRSCKVATAAYKMSKAVPFLPASPALEGYAGEEDGFDPMGFSLALDIRWLREAELKHGRVCMLATLGWITTDLGARVPGEAFQVSTLEAHDAMVKLGNMSQMLVWLGYAELFGFLAIINMMEGKTDRKPGDFGIRVLYPQDERGQLNMQMKELRNGRLAMLAFSGIVTVAVLTEKTWPFLATASQQTASTTAATFCGARQVASGWASGRGVVATRALETSASLPFLPKPANLKGYVGEETEFDPLGFSDTFDMRWLRESELKHGRVCMLATLGFFAQQWLTLPGETPTPDALQAVYTASPASMATLLFAAGWIESSSYGGKLTMLDMFEGDREAGNLGFGTKFLDGQTEEEIKTIKLKELNNGRLAMLGFSGMVHHNLVVKGPLFPLVPEGWEGPQNTWELDSVMTSFVNTTG